MRVIVKGNEVSDTIPVVLTFLVVAVAMVIGAFRDIRENGFKLAGILPAHQVYLAERRLEIGTESVRQVKHKPKPKASQGVLIYDVEFIAPPGVSVSDLKMADYGPDGVAW